MLTISLASLMLLAGCGQVHSNAGNFTVIEYSGPTLNQAADEMESGYCSILSGMMPDYKVLRDQARVD